MTARQRLEQYLTGLRQRIRTHIYVRAAAAVAVSVLALLVAFVWFLQREGFPDDIALAGRIAIGFIVVVVAALLFALPLRRLSRRDGAPVLERHLPAQAGRIETYLDAQRRGREGQSSPLIELLARDALDDDRAPPPADVVPASRFWLAGAAFTAAAVLIAWLLVAGPSFWGFGSRHLLLGSEIPREAVPIRSVEVHPGDVTVRRNSDLTIRASVHGFAPERAQVFVRYADRPDWERAPMQVVDDGNTSHWEFRLFALRGPLQYYVTAEDRRSTERSAEHKVAVVDLPKIDKVRLTYRYPKWTDLPPHTEEASRDIRAVAETQVQVEVFADAPLQSPAIVVDGAAVDMSPTAQGGTGRIVVARPGAYHISATVADERVALTDEYRIEIIDDQKPTIEIRKPGQDRRATSIEEVAVSVQAQDDFRLQQVELRYSVNGGKEQVRRIASGSKVADVESMLRMEELGPTAPGANTGQLLAPGDLVSYYAVAKDRTQSIETDLFVVEVQPFERRFREGQGGGGGGGDDAAGEQGAISERQREILLATWNTQRASKAESRSRGQLEDNAQMLSELQVTLATQARTLAERMRARASVEQDAKVRQFVESLEAAATAMDPAARHLNEFKLDEAISLEQQALQQLLRAEAAFRDVQVAMQRDSANGNGREAERNFTEMFELEMDVDKNHYETQSQLSERNDRDELDEALRKLKELAERQERLAQQANRQNPTREQRWQQEQLRREAEDLRRRLEELTRSQQARSQDSQSGQSQESRSRRAQSEGSQSRSSQSRNGEQGESGNSSESSDALESMREALENMRAANGESGARSAADAGRNLRRALEQMQPPSGESLADRLDQLADRAEKLVAEQRAVESELYDALGDAMGSSRQRGQIAQPRAQNLIQTKQRMADDVNAMQREMRDAMNDHASGNPQSTRRLGEALSDVEAANLVHRLERSAAEIRYGRARDAAPREGLIAEALENLERDLRVVARVAANESKEQRQAADPQQLLAELGELRRALREAGAQEGEGEQAGERGRGQSENPSAEQRAASGEASNRSGISGLDAWNPSRSQRVTAGSNSSARENGAGQFRDRETAEIAERIEALANQPELDLSQEEISALRRMARAARGLNSRSMSSQLDAVTKLVDRLELATLASIERSRDTPAAHAATAILDSPEYREAVAEYYRRLGGACTKGEGGGSC